jgi:hypothetical protein
VKGELELQSSREAPLELLIQRCADGELAEPDERNLLIRLDREPGGWRRLALSFIEHRVLGAACREFAFPSTAATPRQGVRPVRRIWRTTAAQLAALGLALAAAFGIGRSYPRSSPGTAGAITQSQLRAPHNEAPQPSAGPATVMPQAPPSPAAPRGPLPAQYVGLMVPGLERPLPVPVYREADVPGVWQAFTAPAISPGDADRLRRAGYQVTSQRELLRLTAPHEGDVVLPLEAVHVRMSRY